jgi:flagellar protein FliO/FliZ
MLAAGMTGTESILQLLGVFILFILILAVTYYTTRFVGGIKMGQLKKGNFKVMETYKITQNKYLQLVQIGTRYFVIAIGKNEIQLITELQESEITQQDQSVKTDINFLDILTKITNKQNNKYFNKDQINDQNKDQV